MPPSGAQKGKTWGPSTKLQRERSQLTEFRGAGHNGRSGGSGGRGGGNGGGGGVGGGGYVGGVSGNAAGTKLCKSAPNLDKSRQQPAAGSTSPPRHQFRQQLSSSRSDILGKSYDEGLDQLLKGAAPANHTNNKQQNHSNSNSTTASVSQQQQSLVAAHSHRQPPLNGRNNVLVTATATASTSTLNNGSSPSSNINNSSTRKKNGGSQFRVIIPGGPDNYSSSFISLKGNKNTNINNNSSSNNNNSLISSSNRSLKSLYLTRRGGHHQLGGSIDTHLVKSLEDVEGGDQTIGWRLWDNSQHQHQQHGGDTDSFDDDCSNRGSLLSNRSGIHSINDVMYDHLFYKNMQKSVDELFDGNRHYVAPDDTHLRGHYRPGSKSSGDLTAMADDTEEDADSRVSGQKEEDFRMFGSTDSQFRRECFFAKKSDPTSLSMREPRHKQAEHKLQYLSLNDLEERGSNSITPPPLPTTLRESSRNNSVHSRTSEDEDHRLVAARKYSDSSVSTNNSAPGSSSRKNSQVTFDPLLLEPGSVTGTVAAWNGNDNDHDDEVVVLVEEEPRAIKYPPLKSEVSPRKFERVLQLNPDGQKLAGSLSVIGMHHLGDGGPRSTTLALSPSFGSRTKKAIKKREKKKNFFTTFLKKTHRNLFVRRQSAPTAITNTAGHVQERDGAKNENGDDDGHDSDDDYDDDDSSQEDHHVVAADEKKGLFDGVDGVGNGIRVGSGLPAAQQPSLTTSRSPDYDRIYTRNFVIAKQSNYDSL